MRILVIADPHLPIPPSHYGGIERIVAYLCYELQRLGHRVDLMAGPGSESYGGSLIVHRSPSPSYLSRAFRKLWFQFLSLSAARYAEVIINFGRLDYLASVLRSTKPLVCCFQNPVSQGEVNWLLSRRSERLSLIALSQHQIHGLEPRELFTVVHNATDTSRFQFSPVPTREPYLAFLGRLTANKGADTAIRVARQCGMKLKLAGNISDEPGGREFFAREVQPQLDGQIEWVGPVNDAQKQEFLGGASALLFPIRWPEPFGIVMAESLACGTPVVATRCASTPEVIDHGQTGFLCDSEGELVAAVGLLASINRAACRRAAEERFSVPVMTSGYLRVMERLLHECKAGIV